MHQIRESPALLHLHGYVEDGWMADIKAKVG
jgi:hypothetical protein